MSETKDGTITEDKTLQLAADVKLAREMFLIATLSLRSTFVESNPENDKFRKLRDNIYNDVIIYKDFLLPLSREAVEHIKGIFNFYTSLNFDQWYSSLKYIADHTQKYAEQALFLAEAHTNYLTCLKRRQDEAKIIMEELKLDIKKLRDEEEALAKTIKTKNNWAIGLCWIPVVGIISTPILLLQAIDDLSAIIAKEKQRTVTVSALLVIDGPLIRSVENFIKAITQISGFFSLLESEIRSYLNKTDYKISPQFNYTMMNTNAKSIFESCGMFISSVPDCLSNLEAIKNDNIDQNYISTWLSKQIADNKMSLKEWGLRVFKGNKKVEDRLSNY